MKRVAAIFLIMSLAGCAPDHYTAENGVDNSSDSRWAAWRECSKSSAADTSVDHGGLSSGQAVGAALTGAGAGAIGGIIFGAGAASSDNANNNSEDTYIKKCMAKKGYEHN